MSGAVACDETVQLTDDEHSQDCATEDSGEVVGVVDDMLAERRQETRFARELGRTSTVNRQQSIRDYEWKPKHSQC